MSNEIETTWKQLLDKISKLPKRQQKKVLGILLEALRQMDMQARGSGDVSIPLQSERERTVKTEMGTNAIAGVLNRHQWAHNQLVKALKTHGTVKQAVNSLKPEILANLDAYSMGLVQRKIRAEELEQVRSNIKKRERQKWKREHPNCPEGWVDFAMEEVDPIERYGIHPNAISKALREMVQQPFYVRRKTGKAWGRGLSLDAPKPKTRKILNLRGEVIGEEPVEE